jgi:hypothetical protein
VQSPLASRLEFEMLDRVGNVDALAVDACLYERAVEEKPCRPNKRATFAVFSISRLLAHQHDLGVRRTLSEYGLGRILPKRARLTGCSLAPQTLNPIRWVARVRSWPHEVFDKDPGDNGQGHTADEHVADVISSGACSHRRLVVFGYDWTFVRVH